MVRTLILKGGKKEDARELVMALMAEGIEENLFATDFIEVPGGLEVTVENVRTAILLSKRGFEPK